MPVQTKAEEPPKKKPAAKKPTAPKKVTTVKDDSPDSIYHFTNEIIKKLVRSSKWA
jgi:hypothetical protein